MDRVIIAMTNQVEHNKGLPLYNYEQQRLRQVNLKTF